MHIEGPVLWSIVPDNSVEQLSHCQYCTTRLYRCRRRRDLHERSCGQHYGPHETSVKIGVEPKGGAPTAVCEHVTRFCSNWLRVIPRVDEHRCSDCGEVMNTDVPPCNCCYHLEECNCCFFCRSVPCHYPQTASLNLLSVGITSLSPEAFGLIPTKELVQVAADLQKLRLCYTPKDAASIWTNTDMQHHAQNSAKAEMLRKFVLTLPATLDYASPLNSHFRAKLIPFCDAVIVSELNFYAEMLHPNIQLETGWPPFGIQPCCYRARLAASKRLTRIT